MLADHNTRVPATARRMAAAGTGRGAVNRMLKQVLLILLSVTALTAASVPLDAHAERHGQWLARRGSDGSDGGGGTSLNQAVQQVQRDTGGRVLSAETISQGGRSVHRIKVLMPSGQVRVISVDAGR